MGEVVKQKKKRKKKKPFPPYEEVAFVLFRDTDNDNRKSYTLPIICVEDKDKNSRVMGHKGEYGYTVEEVAEAVRNTARSLRESKIFLNYQEVKERTLSNLKFGHWARRRIRSALGKRSARKNREKKEVAKKIMIEASRQAELSLGPQSS